MRLFTPIASLFLGLAWLCADDVTDQRPPWDASLLVSFNRGDATDRSWAAANGTLTNGATIGNNTYATFDGTNDYIDFGNVSHHNAYPITLSIWFNNRGNDQVAYATMLGRYTSGSFNGWFIFMDTSERVVGFYSRTSLIYTGGDIRLLSPASYKADAWHHVVVTVDASGSILYIDGAQVDTDTWTGTAQATTSTASTRAGDHSTGFPWRGDLDDCMIYNRALTAAEVGALYASGRR